MATAMKYSEFWREQLGNELDELGPNAFARKHRSVAKDATPEGYKPSDYTSSELDRYLREQLLNASKGQIYGYAQKRWGKDGVAEQDGEMESEGVPFNDYPQDPERIATSLAGYATSPEGKKAKRLLAAGACARDLFPDLKHLQINVCVSREAGESVNIVNSTSVVEALEKTVPEIFRDLREHFVVLLCDQKHRVIGVHHMAVGSISETIVDPRIVFQPAIVLGASAIFLVHNHPSGVPTPSADDHALTARLFSVGKTLKVKVLDSVIVATSPGGAHVHYSFVDNGEMPTG
jgi:hypothetical protein